MKQRKYRDSSEHAALVNRDFKLKTSSQIQSFNVGNIRTRRISETASTLCSGLHTLVSSTDKINSKLRAPTVLANQSQTTGTHSNVSEQPSTQALVRDIRDATTVKEVRDIMS